jgi:hypothetical protein
VTSLVFTSLFTSIQEPPPLLCVLQNLLTNLKLFISTNVNWSSFYQCSVKHSASISYKLKFRSAVNSLRLFHKLWTLWCKIVNLLSLNFHLTSLSHALLLKLFLVLTIKSPGFFFYGAFRGHFTWVSICLEWMQDITVLTNLALLLDSVDMMESSTLPKTIVILCKLKCYCKYVHANTYFQCSQFYYGYVKQFSLVESFSFPLLYFE